MDTTSVLPNQVEEILANSSVPNEESRARPTIKEPVWMRTLLMLLEIIAIVLIVFYILRLFVLNPYTVSGSSMYPTLKDGELLYINILSYKFKEPQRGDIVVLVPPVDVDKKYVKRIIGIPGDKLQITGDGQVIIFNSKHPEGIALREDYLPEKFTTDGYIIDTLSKDEYFIMGDNRTASSDSRGQTANQEEGIGTNWTVPRRNIVGKVLVRTAPLSSFSFFHDPEYNL
jgi:signal peptidase I